MPSPTMARRVVVLLSPEEFARLTVWADRDSRSPDQQAAYVIRRTLHRSHRVGAHGPDTAARGGVA